MVSLIMWLILGFLAGFIAKAILPGPDVGGVIMTTFVGIIGAVQAAEALKLLSGAGTPLAGRLLMLDGRPMAWSEIRMARDPACAVCGKQHAGAL